MFPTNIYWQRKYRGKGVLFIAIAYTLATSKGQAIRLKGQQQYIGRCRFVKQTVTKNRNFWIGLYGANWVVSHEFLRELVEKSMRLTPNNRYKEKNGMLLYLT